MKCFLLGFVGAVLGLLLSAGVGAQYANYMAAAQTSGWLGDVAPTVGQVTRNIERLQGVSGSGVGVAAPRFATGAPPAMSLVTDDGAILLQGGYKGQAIVLVPSWAKGKASWHCIGGSRHDTLPCEHWRSP